MDNDVDALRAELAALRDEVAGLRVERGSPPDGAVSRRRMLTGLIGLGAAGAAGIAAADPAAAADGDPLVLGTDNDASDMTRLAGALEVSFDPDVLTSVALRVLADTGLSASGTSFGVKSNGRVGVAAVSDGFAALDAWAQGPAKGLRATSEEGPTIEATSLNGVPLVLAPRGGMTGPPVTVPPAVPGSLFVDGECALWLCVAGGPDPTWTRLLREDTAGGRTVPIAPFRAIDTRAPGGRPAGAPAVPGQTQGPLQGSQTVTLDLAGVAPLPTTATGVIGNLTVVAPSYSGYLVARPSGSTSTTSSLNFTKGATVGNSFTSGLGPDGLVLKASGGGFSNYHLVVDVTAYIT